MHQGYLVAREIWSPWQEINMLIACLFFNPNSKKFTGFMQKSLPRLQLHGAIYRPDSFVWMLRYCANLKAIRYESTSLNRIVADKSHRVIPA